MTDQTTKDYHNLFPSEEAQTTPKEKKDTTYDYQVEIGTIYCKDRYFRGVLYTLRNKSNYSREILVTYQGPGDKVPLQKTLILDPHSFTTYPGTTLLQMKILN